MARRIQKAAPFGAGQTLSEASDGGTSTRSPAQSGGTWGPFPEMTTGMTFREVGSSGLRAFSGFVREEFLPELVGRQGARAYREMGDNNAIVGGVLFSIIATMRKVQWRVMPPKNGPENQELIDFVESLKEDMSNTWEDTVAENLSMLQYGYAPHEIVYKRRLGLDPGPDPDRPGHDLAKSRYDDGKIGWKRLPLRGQDTVLKWFFDDNGTAEGLTQQGWMGPLIDLPIQKLLLFRPTHYKSNPEGHSILRSAYRSYFYIKRIEEQEAIVFERMNGLPVMHVPMALLEAAGSGDALSVAAVNNWKRILVNTRIDEQMGLLLPSDTFKNADGTPSAVRQYEFSYVTPANRAAANSKDILDRYGVNIMTSMLADFLHLGHSARGTQALADQKVDMFMQAVEGFLNANAAVYNRHGLPRLFELNGMDPDSQPTLEPDLATRVDLDMLSNFVLRLAQSGMPMFPNDELQSYLLDAAGMPDVTDPLAIKFAGMTDELIGNKIDQQLNPPEMVPPGEKAPEGTQKLAGGGDSPLEKILRASIARRLIKHSGPRFGIETRKRKWAKRNPSRVERVAKYTNGHAT